MILSLILTVVVIICLWIAYGVIDGAPFGDSKIKWALHAIAALIGILVILNLWGIAHISGT